jgi:hypothetical protein
MFIGGGLILLLVVVIIVIPGDPHRRDRISAEQAHLLGIYSDVWHHRAASGFQLSVTQVIEQLTKEKGEAYLQCPVHRVGYAVHPDSTKWAATNRSTEVAMFCPMPHYGRIITAQFNGAVGRIKRPPDWSQR